MYLPESVEYIINLLQKNGHEAFAVGGCVRDSILNRNPDDWDITTSAKPEETKQLFTKTFDTGIEHGTITVLVNNVGYEVTTYRIDGEYEDSRRPNDVAFTTNLNEDLLRRDFTINAMAYNHKQGLVDEFQGMKDLENKIIRCVGNPKERFQEDALRILRAIRFSAQLGFEIEENTQEAIRELAHTLGNISVERIQVELVKLLTSSNPSYINKAYELGVTAIILPEWDEMMVYKSENVNSIYSVGDKTLKSLEMVSNNKVSRLVKLLYNVENLKVQTIDDVDSISQLGKNSKAKSILKRLKFDNNTIHMVCKLISVHDLKIEPSEAEIRKSIHEIGADLYSDFLEIQMVDIMTSNEEVRKLRACKHEEIKKFHKKIMDENHCVSLNQLKINGKDLLGMGVPQGKLIGEILNILLIEVLEDHNLNNIEFLKERVYTILNTL